MFLHPRCPCTRASLAELEKLHARLKDRWELWLIPLRPLGTNSDWAETSLVCRAAAIPGVHVFRDDGGRLANLLGARTSGECFLYDPAGRLAFHGGITPARGHEGDNPGSQAIAAFVGGEPRLGNIPAISPTFGCPLTNHSPVGATFQEILR